MVEVIDVSQKISSYQIPVQLALMYIWCTNLTKTDSFYSLYLLCLCAGIFSLLLNNRCNVILTKKQNTFLWLCSVVFSFSVILANYSLFLPVGVLLNWLNFCLCLVGGTILARNVLLFTVSVVPISKAPNNRHHPTRFFLITFTISATINLAYLFLCKYPGVAPQDTVSQMAEAMNLSDYSNWTPYWHTVTIELFYDIGYFLFHDVNAALCTYTAVQAVFASLCYAYLLTTLYQLRLPTIWLGFTTFLYCFLPYNIIFSITIGKDILFGLGLLLMITGLARILLDIGKVSWLNYFAFFIGSVGFSLWRTNGFFIYVIFSLICGLCFYKSMKKLLLFMGIVSVFCWALLNPYLEAREISDGAVTETMAVPFQQIARVVVNERELSEEETEQLSIIFHLDEVKEVYTPIRVDPVKFEAFRDLNYEYFTEHLGDYAKLWIQIGLKYPGDYTLAWIDQTKGFWHGGYDMGVYDKQFPGNDLGIENIVLSQSVSSVVQQYFRLFERPDYLVFFKSIGFAVWIILMCFVVNLMRRRKQILLALPQLILLLSFWLGVPVFAEFRYAYPLFVTSPLVVMTTLVNTEE